MQRRMQVKNKYNIQFEKTNTLRQSMDFWMK